MRTTVKDEKTEATKEVTIDTDEGVRPATTVEGLAKLPPAFRVYARCVFVCPLVTDQNYYMCV